MYSMIIFSSTAPTVAQKYPRAHWCCPQYRFRKCRNASCSRRDNRPLTYCTNFAAANCGGVTGPPACTGGPVTPLPAQSSSPALGIRAESDRGARSATSPRRILYRYFVIIDTPNHVPAESILAHLLSPLPQSWRLKAYHLKVGGIRPGTSN